MVKTTSMKARIWKKRSLEEMKARVFSALEQNVNYHESSILGVPASYLDDKVFNQDASFVKDAPWISTLIQNPNHIGCHTLGKSESFFKGTQEIEKELIEMCAVDILGAEVGTCDGYVASGGTEANMQAIWVYRNYFIAEFGARKDEIMILCTEDSHYSMNKASNILGVNILKVKVDEKTREVNQSDLTEGLHEAKQNGKKYAILVGNMMTTMFGSVDDLSPFLSELKSFDFKYKVHIDGAYGGFYHPFTEGDKQLNFSHPEVSSVTLDAHKMARAPYGTGIFLMRKGLIQYANTQEASYVEGEDYTLIGSRSGANAVAVWMILSQTGPYGWQEKVFILQKRTAWFCAELDTLGVDYFRHPDSNIVTIDAHFVNQELAKKYGLVPDNHHSPRWFKVVIMEHVTLERLEPLLEDLKSTLRVEEALES